MVKVVYDFREGLDREKIIYKDTSCDCRSCMYYILYLLFTWIYCGGFFALFHYSYINYEPTAFWVYTAIWFAFIVFLLTIIIYNLIHQRAKKKTRKAEEKLIHDRILEEEIKKKQEIERVLKENEKVNYNSNENEMLRGKS